MLTPSEASRNVPGPDSAPPMVWSLPFIGELYTSQPYLKLNRDT